MNGKQEGNLYDLQGRLVAQPLDRMQAAGRHASAWDRAGSRGRASAGIYFVRLEAAGRSLTRRLVVVD